MDKKIQVSWFSMRISVKEYVCGRQTKIEEIHVEDPSLRNSPKGEEEEEEGLPVSLLTFDISQVRAVSNSAEPGFGLDKSKTLQECFSI